MNQVILIGRVVRDCEINILQNQNKTNVMKFTLAVDRDYKNKNGETPTDFLNIELFGNDFTKLKNYVLKGTKLAVMGSIHIDKGDKGSFTKIKANKIELLETKNPEMEKNGIFSPKKEQKESFYPNSNTKNTQNGVEMGSVDDQDDIPF